MQLHWNFKRGKEVFEKNPWGWMIRVRIFLELHKYTFKKIPPKPKSFSFCFHISGFNEPPIQAMYVLAKFRSLEQGTNRNTCISFHHGALTHADKFIMVGSVIQ